MASACVAVIDPCNRTGKVEIPAEYITTTRGLTERHRPQTAKDLSLCLLFQAGHCKAGYRCHQIHADPIFVSKIRAQALQGSACCALHGDVFSTDYLARIYATVEVISENEGTRVYRLSSFSRTAVLDRVICSSASNTRINAAKLCRLHLQGKCKFGKDCKNIHLCPTAAALVVASEPEATVLIVKPPQPLTGLDNESTPSVKRTMSINSSSCGASSIGASETQSDLSAIEGAKEQLLNDSATLRSLRSTPPSSPLLAEPSLFNFSELQELIFDSLASDPSPPFESKPNPLAVAAEDFSTIPILSTPWMTDEI